MRSTPLVWSSLNRGSAKSGKWRHGVYVSCPAERLGALRKFYGQATKGAWWMPWQKMAMKDVASCDKPLGSRKQALIRGCPNGETLVGKTYERPDEYIVRYERT